MDGEERKQSDMELLASGRAIVDRSKLIPLGTMHGQISEMSKGLTAKFHPGNGARDYDEHKVTNFFNYPYEVGQIIDKGSKVAMEERNVVTLSCGHAKKTTRDVVEKQYVLCKKCRTPREIVKVERKLVQVVTKKSTDDLLFFNTMNRIDRICKDLRFDEFTRDCLGGEAREQYQTGVNWFEEYWSLKSLLDMAIEYKGLGLQIYQKYFDRFLEMVNEIRMASIDTLRAGAAKLDENARKQVEVTV